jgi:hypothetical protein
MTNIALHVVSCSFSKCMSWVFLSLLLFEVAIDLICSSIYIRLDTNIGDRALKVWLLKIQIMG